MSLMDFLIGGFKPTTTSSSSSFSSKIVGHDDYGYANELLADLLAKLFSSDEKKSRGLEDGDVVGVSRMGYEHYGVYIGNDKVIHYSSDNSDISTNNRIMETSFSKFLGGNSSYFILNLEYVEPRKYDQLVAAENRGILSSSNSSLSIAIRAWQKCQKREVFSATETIRRAKSRLGENEYNLLLNNCEHFAIWCKTGISQSHQIEDILRGSPKIGNVY